MCNCAYKEIQRGHTVSLVPQAIKALLRILFKSWNGLKSGTISKSFDFQNFGIKLFFYAVQRTASIQTSETAFKLTK